MTNKPNLLAELQEKELSLVRGGKLDMRIEKTRKCWNWLGETMNKGYARIFHNGKYHRAHRVVYELYYKKKINPMLVLDHLCRNRACVNPRHLEEVTNKENLLRGIGWGAKNAQKTHCLKGHKLSGPHTKLSRGARVCMICRRDRERAYKKRKRLSHLSQLKEGTLNDKKTS